MSDHDAKVEAVPLPGQDPEQEHYSESALELSKSLVSLSCPSSRDPCGACSNSANPAIPGDQNDQERDAYEPERRLSDPQGKLRGKSSQTVIKSNGGGGSSSRPGGGPKNDESDSDKSPEDPGETQGGTSEPSAPSGGAEQPAPPRKKGKLRGKAAPAASKAGGKGNAGQPGGAKT